MQPEKEKKWNQPNQTLNECRPCVFVCYTSCHMSCCCCMGWFGCLQWWWMTFFSFSPVFFISFRGYFHILPEILSFSFSEKNYNVMDGMEWNETKQAPWSCHQCYLYTRQANFLVPLFNSQSTLQFYLFIWFSPKK